MEACTCIDVGVELPNETPAKSTGVVYLVAVFDCGQRYGGPEEGGWWYDTGSFVRQVKQFRNEDKAYAYCRRLNKRLQSRKFGPNEGKRSYTSVLSDGEYQASVWENEVPKGFPERRPHYE